VSEGWCIGLFFITFVIGGLVEEFESSSSLLFLSKILVFACAGGFLSFSLLLFYFFFEFSLFPILVSILFYGGQVEKVRAAYYLLFYGSFFSLPLFYFLLICGRGGFFWRGIINYEVSFLCRLGFIIKLPVFFFSF